MGHIYVATCAKTGKQYVGQTVKTVDFRWKQHVVESGTSTNYNSKLNRAIRKYGEDAFNLNILEEVDDNALDKREIFWIEKLNTFHNGYNCTTGGGGVPKYDQTFRKKIRDLWDNGFSIADIKRLMGCSTDVVRETLAIHQNYIDYRKEKIEKVPYIMQYDFDGNYINSYSSLDDAATATGAKKAAICSCCNGKYHSAGGYQWRYRQDSEPTKIIPHKKQVTQYTKSGDYIRTYNSAGEAGRLTGVDASHIRECCKGTVMSAGGFQWRYAVDNHPGNYADLPKSKQRRVNQYDSTGKYLATYDSIKDAATATGSYRTAISLCCRGELRHSNNYQWRFVGDAPPGKLKRQARAIDQYTKDGIFVAQHPSIHAAAKSVHTSTGNIYACCNKASRTIKGFIWKYANV